ncbi:MAG: adenylate/guanylate cyclase, partial [Spirochaetes bacterium]
SEPSKPGKPDPKAIRGALTEIRASILEDIRVQGRRLSVDEALAKYGWHGPEATEVVANLAETGILVRREKNSSPDISNKDPHSNPISFSSNDIGKSIEAAIHAIVSEVERSVSQGSSLKATISKRKPRNPAAKNSFSRYRDELRAKADKKRRGVAGALISFFTINPLLWYINIEHARGFPWAPIVSIFWGSGVLETVFGTFRAKRHAREADALPDLDEADAKELKALNKERDSIAKHALNTITIPGALFFINMATNSASPWFVIPSAIMVITFFIHLATYLSSTPRKLRGFFERVGVKGGKKGLAEARRKNESIAQDLGSYSSLYDKAWETAKDIESDLSAEDPKSAKEMKPALDAYLGQVLLLAKTANELDSIIGEIPMEALAKDKQTLAIKLERAPQGMQTEYKNNIAEIEKQEESFKALKEQREVIDLRLQSSVNQLNQLKMDLVRARAADRENTVTLGQSALNSIKARAEELSLYIDDLKKGHLETLADPFAELEKTYNAKD